MTTKPYAHKNKNPEMPLFRIKQQIPQQNSSLLDKVAEPRNKIANYTTEVAKSLNLQILQQNSPFWEWVADSHNKTANNARKVANICNFAKNFIFPLI